MLRHLIHRPIAVSMIVFCLVVLGIVSSRLIPVSLVPDIDAPYMTVQVSEEGFSARQMEEVVLEPLRMQLMQIPELAGMDSEAKEGSGLIHLSFNHGSDMDYLFVELNEKIDKAMPLLPYGMERPKVIKASATDIPAFYLNVSLKEESGAMPMGRAADSVSRFLDLSRFVRQVLVLRIEQLPEVAMVDVSGAMEAEYRIVPDLAKLEQIGVGLDELEAFLREADVQAGSLSIQDGKYQYHVKFGSPLKDPEDIAGLYLKIHGKLYRLGDLASVSEHPRLRQGQVLSDGKMALSLAIVKQADVRMAELKRSIDKQLAAFEADYPDVDFLLTRDQTELLDYSIHNLVTNIVAGIVFACLIIFLFMRDLKSSLLVNLTIPLTLVISLVVFYLMGLSINIISLSGLVLGIGMLVDNSIVVVDNMTARWERREPLDDAVVHGTKEVAMPMLSSVLTTCAVFLPLMFLSGMAGALFYEQAMAIAITLFVAYGLAVTLLPVYYRWWYGKQDRFRTWAPLDRFSFDRVTALYERALKWNFRHRGLMWTVYAVSAIGIAFLFVRMGKERLPEMSYRDMLVKVDWNASVSVEENVSRSMALVNALEGMVTQSTVWAGMQQFLLSQADEQGSTESTVYLKCGTHKEVEKVQEKLREWFAREYPDAVYSFSASGNVFEQVFGERSADLVVRIRPLQGKFEEAAPLQALVDRIRDSLSKAGLDYAVPPLRMQDELVYVAKPELMALYGVSYQALHSVLQDALAGHRVFELMQGSEDVPVVVGAEVPDLPAFLAASVVKGENLEVPVPELLQQTMTEDFALIKAGSDGCYYPLEFALQGRDAGTLMRIIEACVAQEGGFDVDFEGGYFANRDLVRQLGLVLVVAVLLLYLILAAQFESLVQPCIILSEILVDLFGALLLLTALGQSLNLMSMIGLIVVCGIVINDSILKIDTINVLRREGYSLKRAILLAGQRRLKPIVMTSLTTILSVLPFLAKGEMGSDLQYPMSLAIIGGMVVGTLVSVIFIPLAYYVIYKGKERGRNGCGG